jgi:hypothetical protein
MKPAGLDFWMRQYVGSDLTNMVVGDLYTSKELLSPQTIPVI